MVSVTPLFTTPSDQVATPRDQALDYDEIRNLYYQHLSSGRAKVSDVFGTALEVSAQGAWIETSDGTKHLNAGGYGVFIHGARHPYVEAAVIRQIQSTPIASRILMEPQVALAATALARIAPKGLSRVHFAGAGTEATEAAIKLARTQGCKRLVSMENGYHGKTMGSLSVTARALYQDPFRPLLPDVSHVPFGDANALAHNLRKGERACVILEPIQGEGGVHIPPEGYLREVRGICDQYGAILVFDEIQTGMGRLGCWWGANRENVSPDILLVGKGLSGGIVPVSAMVATPEAFKAFDKDPIIHTSTFSGAPIAVAAARAAIEAIEQDQLLERAKTIGDRLLQQLKAIVALRCPYLVNDVRGVGLLIGIEMKSPGLAGALLSELIAQRLIVNYSLNASTVLRFTPPAVMSEDDIDFMLSAFDRACDTLAELYPTHDTIGVY